MSVSASVLENRPCPAPLIVESATNTLRQTNDEVLIMRTVLKCLHSASLIDRHLPLTLVRIWKQSMGGDTGGCGLVIRVHRTFTTQDSCQVEIVDKNLEKSVNALSMWLMSVAHTSTKSSTFHQQNCAYC